MRAGGVGLGGGLNLGLKPASRGWMWLVRLGAVLLLAAVPWLVGAAQSTGAEQAAAKEPVPVAAAGTGTSGTGFALRMTYEREGLPVPQWTFKIAPSGMVEYASKHAQTATSPPGVTDGEVRFPLSRTGAAKLAGWLEASRGLVPCETKSKNLARMGQKTLVYTPAGGGAAATCSFNYTDNRALASAAEYMSAVSSTLEEGATLDRLHRYDRLGLDPVMMRLAAAAKEGKAPELAAIGPSLEALVADDAVLERVRLRAAQLLELAKQQ